MSFILFFIIFITLLIIIIKYKNKFQHRLKLNQIFNIHNIKYYAKQTITNTMNDYKEKQKSQQLREEVQNQAYRHVYHRPQELNQEYDRNDILNEEIHMYDKHDGTDPHPKAFRVAIARKNRPHNKPRRSKSPTSSKIQHQSHYHKILVDEKEFISRNHKDTL